MVSAIKCTAPYTFKIRFNKSQPLIWCKTYFRPDYNLMWLNQPFSIQQLSDEVKQPEKEYQSQYAIRVSMLPNYIPTRIAAKILFVGESVQMFENRKHSGMTSSKYITGERSEGINQAWECMFNRKPEYELRPKTKGFDWRNPTYPDFVEK